MDLNVNLIKGVILLLILILVIIFPISIILNYGSCHAPFETCDHLSTDLTSELEAIFCINVSTNFLQSVHIYDCDKITKFSAFDSYEIFRAFTSYFKNEKNISINATPYKLKSCPFIFHEHLVKLCFDSNRIFSNVILFDKIIMHPQEAYHLYNYLKIFLINDTS